MSTDPEDELPRQQPRKHIHASPAPPTAGGYTKYFQRNSNQFPSISSEKLTACREALAATEGSDQLKTARQAMTHSCQRHWGLFLQVTNFFSLCGCSRIQIHPAQKGIWMLSKANKLHARITETLLAHDATSGALASSRDALRADSDLRAYGPCHQRDCTAGILGASTAVTAARPRHYQ
jgi:hypothetical protein